MPRRQGGESAPASTEPGEDAAVGSGSFRQLFMSFPFSNFYFASLRVSLHALSRFLSAKTAVKLKGKICWYHVGGRRDFFSDHRLSSEGILQ